MNIERMKRDKKEAITKMRAMLDAAEQREDKALTEAETAEYNKLDAEISRMGEAIEREERLAAMEATTTVPVATRESGMVSASEYRNFGEFVMDAIHNKAEKRETTLGTPAQAGLLVPPEFVPGLRKVAPELTIVRPRATIIPSSSSPEATANVNALDQFNDNGVYGGVNMAWTAETGTRTSAGDVKVVQIPFTPNLITGFIEISNVLLNNAAEVGRYANDQMALAIAAAEEVAFLRGDGAGKPLGFIGHPCNATITRGTAGTIVYDDVVGMLTKTITTPGQYIFIASRSALPKLMTLKDTAGNLIWQPDARVGSPGTLLGYPVMFSERVPALGTAGDLVLADLSFYGIKDGSPLSLVADPYTQMHRGVTRLYVTWSVDGRPLLNTRIKGEDGELRSAFVALQ